MPQNRVFAIKFSSVYPHYVQKAERKNRTKEEVARGEGVQDPMRART